MLIRTIADEALEHLKHPSIDFGKVKLEVNLNSKVGLQVFLEVNWELELAHVNIFVPI